MFYKFCAFFVIAGFSCFAGFADMLPPQVVTSEVFYNYDEYNEESQDVNSVRDEYTARQTAPVRVVVEQQQIPVWPMTGTDADFKIVCKDQECTDNGQLKIVSKIGSNLVIENNINTSGTGWSGGPSVTNDRPVPTGFDYECINTAEMPLLQREMMEDDGGTVLAMSRSARRICNKQPDSYMAFAERSGFDMDKTKENDVKSNSEAVKSKSENIIAVNSETNMNEYNDAEPAATVKNEVRSWVVVTGQTLRSTLESWCAKEGWDLVWATAREYPIEASAVFKGRFVDVASAMVRNFERAAPAPYAKFYKGNRVLVITTME